MEQTEGQQDGQAGAGAFGYQFLTDVPQQRAADRLIKSDASVVDFLPLTRFKDDNEVREFAKCIYKCKKNNLKELEGFFYYLALGRVAVKENRAEKYVEAITGILRFAKEAAKNERKADRKEESPTG